MKGIFLLVVLAASLGFGDTSVFAGRTESNFRAQLKNGRFRSMPDGVVENRESGNGPRFDESDDGRVAVAVEVDRSGSSDGSSDAVFWDVGCNDVL